MCLKSRLWRTPKLLMLWLLILGVLVFAALSAALLIIKEFIFVAKRFQMITVGNVKFWMQCVLTFGTGRHKRQADITLLFQYIFNKFHEIPSIASIYLFLLARSHAIITPGSANLEFWRKKTKQNNKNKKNKTKKNKKNLRLCFD